MEGDVIDGMREQWARFKGECGRRFIVVSIEITFVRRAASAPLEKSAHPSLCALFLLASFIIRVLLSCSHARSPARAPPAAAAAAALTQWKSMLTYRT